MARYTYNAGLVTQTIDKLYSACDSLDSTNVDIQKGIDMILNARGAENINVDFTPITGYQSSVIEYIETMTTEINKKAQEIEEYQDAPWYKKLFATIGMGALKLVEGLATFVENIGDCLVSIVGFIGGIFSSDFRDCLGEFVKKDWVGDTTAKWYEEGWLKDVNKYSIMSHESTAANVLKGIGVAAGYVIISVATAGAGTAVSLGVSAATAAAGAIGAGTQSGLQAGMTFNQAFGQGVKQGAVAAATTLVIGGIANKLGNLAKGVGGAIDDAGAAIANSADDVLAITAGTADDVLAITAGAADDVANAAINSADDVANALVNSADDVANVAANAADDVANAAINSTDDVANAAANATDDVANATDDVVKAGDDALEVVGEKTTSDGRKWLKVKDSNGTPDLVEVGTGRSGVQGTQYTAEQLKNIGINVGDDIANSLDDVANSADDVVNAAANSADDVTNAAVNSADDLTNAASKNLILFKKLLIKLIKQLPTLVQTLKLDKLYQMQLLKQVRQLQML